MSIVHKSTSGQTTQDVFAPETAVPLMGRSSAPPPFQLIASLAGGEEELEVGELLPEKTDASQILADGDAGDEPAVAGGATPNGAATGSDEAGAGNPPAAPVDAAPDISALLAGGGGEALPELLRANIETMSGYDMSGVTVNYNSDKPKLLRAGAYARGNQIELASGYEKDLATAAWALVQQRQGRVAPTTTTKGIAVNEDAGLKTEAEAKRARLGSFRSRLRRMRRRNFNSLIEGENPAIIVVPGSFRVIDEDEDPDVVVAEPILEDVDTEPFAPTVPENVVVDVPEIDLTLGYDNLRDITKGSLADTLGISLDFLRSVVFNLTVKFSFYLGIEVEVLKGLFGIEGGFLFEAAASLNQQDDRLVRAGWTLSYGGKLTTTILWFIKNTNTWMHSFGKLSVYQDMAHFSAHQFTKMGEMVDVLAEETGEVERLPESSQDSEGRDMAALRASDPTDVYSSGYSRKHEIGIGGTVPGGADYGLDYAKTISNKEMNFYRGEGEDREVRQATQEDVSHSLTLTIGKTEVTLDFTETQIANHANEDNDGHYRNFSVTLKNPPSHKIAFANKFGDVMQNIAERVVQAAASLNSQGNPFQRVKTMVQNEASELLSDFDGKDGPSAKPTGAIDHYYTAEFNLVKSQEEWALQYLRLSKGTAASLGFEADIPVFSNGVVGVNLHLKTEASIDFSSTILEVTSGQTMSYFMTVYNGLVYTDAQVASGFAPSKEGGWVAYRQQHQLGITRLLKNMANPESVAHKEVAGFAGDHPSSVPLLLQAAGDYAEGKIDLDVAISALENFFAENYVKKGERSQELSSDTENTADINSDGRTPWGKVVGGSSEYTANMDNTGAIVLTQDAFNPANANTANKPRAMIESLLQDQSVKCRLKIPYYEKVQTGISGPRTDRKRTYEYNHNSDQNIDIPRLTNRLQAAQHLQKGFNNAWGSTPFKIPSAIRSTYFNTTNLNGIISEIYSLQNLGRNGHPRRRNGYKARARSMEASYIGEAKEEINKYMDQILTTELA